MSGLGDLASWALRGVGAGNQNNEENQDESNNETIEELSPEEMRAQRLARMEALQKQQQQQQQQQEQQAATAGTASEDPKPMDIDENPTAKDVQKKNTPANKESPGKIEVEQQTASSPPAEHKKRKAKESHSSPADYAGKVQKKAELLLKKVLSISLANTSTTSDSSCVVIDIDDAAITVQTIAEILATRLALPAKAPELRTMPAQKSLIPYLAQCHRRASEEAKTMKQSKKGPSPDLLEILVEIKRQVVSYASSCLMVPELFEMGHDASLQLAKCFTTNVMDPASSITFGVTGSTSSFYYLLCEELLSSDSEAFERVIADVVNYLTKQLERTESVLDAGDGADGSALVVVTALTSVCVHKKAAETVTFLPSFLLPAAGTPEASETVDNRPPPGADLMSRIMAMRNHSYLRRSGPGLDKNTILGLCLRPGIPRINPAFSSPRMTINAVESTTSSQRQQLRVHQEACNQLVVALVKAGPNARSKVRLILSVVFQFFFYCIICQWCIRLTAMICCHF